MSEDTSSKSESHTIPKRELLMNPVIHALRELGGSGSIDEIADKVAATLKLPEESLSVLHDPQRDNRTEFQYQLGWARNYLKRYGLLETSGNNIWSLTPKVETHTEIDASEVIRFCRKIDREEKKQRLAQKPVSPELFDKTNGDEEQSWRIQIHHILTKTLAPSAFERLIQRLLRESGFIQVEVVGRSGDGGIDGKGIARIHGFMSFHVVFQCKRWQGVVGASEIRDFRGAMVGRADKGLFITTGTFSRDAIKEATRDGAPPIDLVDGDLLADKLKELKLGVTTTMIESVSVDAAWFEGI